MAIRRSIVISSIGLLTSLAVAITFTGFEVPFPLLPYLKFDLSEIPVMTAFLLLGPVSGLVSCVIFWLALTAARGWVLGPVMKFIAVASTILGFWLGTKANLFFRKNSSTSFPFIMGTAFSIIVRVFSSTVTNIVVLLWVAPEFFVFAQMMLALVGITVSSTFDVLLWTSLLTGIFNLLHALLSSIPPAIFLKGLAFRIPWVSETAWFLTLGNKRV